MPYLEKETQEEEKGGEMIAIILVLVVFDCVLTFLLGMHIDTRCEYLQKLIDKKPKGEIK